MSDSAIRLPKTLSIPYQKYAQGGRVGARAQLDDVRIHSIQAELQDLGAIAQELRPDITVDVTVSAATQDGAFVVATTYTVILTRVGDADEEGEQPPEKEAAMVSVGVAGLYGSEELPDDVSDDEMEAFAASAGVLALHPYAREVISTTIQRFGLPALMIPPLRVVSDEPLDSRD